MKSQINREIFSESGCVSRELLLRYRDGKLSQSEQHEVEKHLIDCPLCADAYEGFVLAGSAGIPDDIDTGIRELTGSSGKTSYVSYIAIAASVAAIAILSFFMVDQFKEVKEERMAVATEVTPQEFVPESSVVSSTDSGSEISNVQPSPVVNQIKEEKAVESNIANVAERHISDSENQIAPASALQSDDMVSDEVAELKDVKPESTSGAVTLSEVAPVSSTEMRAVPYMSNVTYIDNLKVIDYSAVNKNEAEQKTVSHSTPSKYQNKKQQVAAENDASVSGEVTSRKVNYLQLLADPIALYNKGRYESAIEGFDEILEINRDDENAGFYKGMSLYHLKRYDEAIVLLSPIAALNTNPFSEEAYFYVGKSYLAKGNKSKATSVFRKIVAKNGFYAERAKQELVMME